MPRHYTCSVDISSFAGTKIGRLTVISCLEPHPPSQSLWLCRCECGKEVSVRRHNLVAPGRSGSTRSCGCSKSVRRLGPSNPVYKHGRTGTREYRIWRAMLKRCTCPTAHAYSRYGARGIEVCPRWRASFADFFADMGPAPGDASIDRIDNDGHYEPGNCRWATSSQQARNRGNNQIIEYLGRALSVAEWVEETGIPYGAIWTRLRAGWSTHDILTRPVRITKRSAKKEEE